MLPSIPMALDINITKYIFNLAKVISSSSSLVLFIIIFIYVIKKNSFEFGKRNLSKTVLSISLSFIVFGVLESITVPVILYLTNKPLEFFNNNILMNFVLSLPSRILCFSIIIYIVIKRNNQINVKLFETISKNKFLLRSIISFAIISNLISVYILKLIGTNRILENKVSLIEQMIITMSVIIVPALILIWLLLLINYLLVVQKRIQQTYETLLSEDNVMADVEDQK
jgi:hypothetical protein